MRFVALPGFRDLFPDALARRRRIFAVWREVAERYGFEEYDGPPLEPLELYTDKSGEEIVEQLYTFTDKGGRRVALRPEMTPTLARMVGERAAQQRKPLRWYSVPQLFRYERPQKGRLREHFQLNVDVIGEPGPLADAEVIAVAIDIMRAFGLGPAEVRVRLSDRRVLAEALTTGFGVLDAELPDVLVAFDRYERSREAADAALERVFAGDHARADGVKRFAASLGEAAPLLELPAASALKECLDHLRAMGLGEFVDVDFRIVRGLAYYTGIVFELFDAQHRLRALCGGGRYDDLLRQLGGVDLPMVGFGMGDVVLGELLAKRELRAAAPAVEVFVATVTEEDRPAALALAHALRDRGLRVEYALGRQALKKQLDLANARGASYAVVIGPEERAAGDAVVRDLAHGAEQRLPLDVVRSQYAFGRGGARGGKESGGWEPG